MRIPLAVLLAAGLSTVIAAQQQNQFEQQVRQQLDKIGTPLKSKGFELTDQVYRGALKAETDEAVTFRLRRGVRYALVGVCDQDCGDLDLRLFDPGGREIDSDVQEDDAPVVAVAPKQKERYTVQAIMADCTASPCRYGIGVFRK